MSRSWAGSGDLATASHGDRRSAARGIGWEFVHVCVDDATRLAYVEVLPDERATTCVAFLAVPSPTSPRSGSASSG